MREILRGGNIPSCSRDNPNRNPEWIKKQQKKIAKGSEDAETKEYRLTLKFDSIFDAIEEEGLSDMTVRMNVGTKENPIWKILL